MGSKLKQSTVVKILTGITVITLLLSFYFLFEYQNSGLKVLAIKENLQNIINNALKFESTSQRASNFAKAFVSTGDEIYSSQYWDEVYNKKIRENAIYELNRTGLNKHEKGMLASIINESNKLIIYEELAIESIRSGETDIAINAIYGRKYLKQTILVNTSFVAFISQIENRLEDQMLILTRQNQVILILAICMFIAGVLHLVMLNIYVRKHIFDPIKKICKEMQGIEKGDFVCRTNLVPGNSEIGSLISLVYSSKNKLRDTTDDIKEVLDKIANEDYNIKIGKDYNGKFDEIKESLENIIKSRKKRRFF